LINIPDNIPYDLDDVFGIGDIKSVVFHDDIFYVLCNKRDQKIGYFILKLSERNPLKGVDDKEQMEKLFLMNYKNKLAIGDADCSILKDGDKTNLLVSFKTCYVNTYSIYVISLLDYRVVFRHESFCLWETPITGFLNHSTLDYITLDQHGMGVLVLSSELLKKELTNHQNQKI